MAELKDNMDYIRSCAWSFIREYHLSPRIYYKDVEQEAGVAWILWRRKLDSGDCPKDWEKFARTAIRYHLQKHYAELTGWKPGQPAYIGSEPVINNIEDIVFARDWLSTLPPDERRIVYLLYHGEKQMAKKSLSHGTYYRKRKHIQDSYRNYFGDAG